MLQASAERLLAAAFEQTAAHVAIGSGAAAQRRAARRDVDAALSNAMALARGDATSTALLAAIGREPLASRRRAGATASARLPGADARLRADVSALVAHVASRRSIAQADARHASRRALAAIMLSAVLVVGAVLALLWLLIARVRSPLAELAEAARRLAGGDLGARVRAEGPQEVRTVAGAFNAMADDLADALARLDAERRRLSRIVESLGEALLVVRADGTIDVANPLARELLPELAPGTRIDATELLPPLGAALGHEVTLQRAGRVLAATAAQMPDGEDAAPDVVWTLRDVSERARLEQLKTEFVATASHELRSPLTSIKGFVELLDRGTGLGEREREFVQIIRLSTDRLVELVDDLLDLARIEAGQIEIAPRPTDLVEVVEETVRLMGPRLREKRQHLSVDAPLDLPLVLADPVRLREIVTNLLTNAHTYTPEGGHVSVRLGAEGGLLSLQIADDGPGIDPLEVDRVFDRFYRGAGRTGGSGTGLGLSIVKSLVDAHGGTIEVHSAPGRGTTFTVRLSAAVPRDDGARPQAPWAPRLHVVDDADAGRVVAARSRRAREAGAS
jgi:signal transduction histidine kinase